MTSETFSAAEQLSGLSDIDPDVGFFEESDSIYYSDVSFNQLLCNDPSLGRQFSAIFLNIRSAVKNLEPFHDYLLTLATEFTIIALAETWLTSDSEHLCNLPGYKYHGNFRKNRVGGGVGFLVRSMVAFKAREDLDLFNDHIETTFIEIPYSCIDLNTRTRALVGVIYRPPGANLDSFLTSLVALLNQLRVENKTCYLMGDFNINLMNHDSHSQTNGFLDLMYTNAFHPLINKPTRITSYSSTLIDNIFHNSFSSNQLSGILYTDISDHLPVFVLSRTGMVPYEEPVSFEYRRFNDRSIGRFRELLQGFNWQELYNKSDSESAYNFFIENIQSMYNTSFPLTLKLRNPKKKKPWISVAIKKSISKKNKLYKKYHRIPTLLNEIAYKTYKNNLNRLIQVSKKLYYNNALDEHKSNLKRTWQILKEIVGLPDKSALSKAFVVNDREVTDPKEIANSLNEYFVNVGTNLASSIPHSNLNPTDRIDSSPSSIYLVPVVEGEVLRCLSQLKDGSAGHDSLKPSVIKLCKESLVTPLTFIYNMSITEGCVPNSLKYAYVTPVFKSGDQGLMNNYRPISVLPVFSKILEKLIFNRLYSFVADKDYLSINQYGFRRGLSTEMALIMAIDKITQAIENREHCIGLFLDLKKAFDTVDGDILLKKLYCYGIRGNALKWFNSYLTNRTQSVKYFNSISNKLPVTMGVPQGSILGPLLFILYVNDMPKVLQNAKPIIFADDTTLFVSNSDIDLALHLLQEDVDKLVLWFTANKLSLNLSKTNYMLFTTNTAIRSRTLSFEINGITIERVQSCKFLGIFFDEKLSWSCHVDYLCKKLRKSIGILKKVSHILDVPTMKILYYSMIYPYLIYCHLVWGSTSASHITRISRLQKRAIRIICKVPRLSHTLPLFTETKIIPVNNLYQYLLSLLTYKLFTVTFPSAFCNQTGIDRVGLSPARNTNFRLPLCRTTLRQKTIFYKIPKFCNSFLFRLNLPENLSFNCFKKLMKNIFL